MIILPKSGLVATVKKVREYLAENGVDADIYFGWKPSARTTIFPRVCIVPSDPDTGDSGYKASKHIRCFGMFLLHRR